MLINPIVMVYLQTILFVVAAPLFCSWIKFVKCLLQNRKPPSLLQTYKDLYRLFNKRVIWAENASVLFRIAPYLILGAIVLAGAITPFLTLDIRSVAVMDAIALTGLFAFSRFFLALAGMDVGTAFGGMGSSREMSISAFSEPAMLLTIFTVAMVASSTNLAVIIHQIETQLVFTRPSLWFAAAGLLMVIVAESGRIPVDNPSTHLELTMIHEAMILEYNGRFLAMLELASQLKLLIFAVIAINIFNPWGIAHQNSIYELSIAAALISIKLLVFGTLLAMLETALAKMRLFAVPMFMALSLTLSLGGMLSFIILEAG